MKINEYILENKDILVTLDPFHGDETDYICFSRKLVTTRKEHECMICGSIIKSKSLAMVESGKNNELNIVSSSYFCNKCCKALLKDNMESDCKYMNKRWEIGINVLR